MDNTRFRERTKFYNFKKIWYNNHNGNICINNYIFIHGVAINSKKEVLQIVASYINEKIEEKKHTIIIKDEFVFFNYNFIW